jgi:hypothetical protein
LIQDQAMMALPPLAGGLWIAGDWGLMGESR